MQDILPFGARGAVVVTGDDDQAYLEDYLGQAKKLGRLPVTYFLHPLTRHVAESLARHEKGCLIEWELHPDALDTPGEYATRLAEQCEWFHKLTGRRPRFLRNHGFLNDGYWGHARPWLDQGIVGSSNLPGVNGNVLNGSLLPARLSLNGVLTSHWSQLTAFGDGVFFIYDWDATVAIGAILAAAQQIIDSGVPGVLVFNVHPANHEKAAPMLDAVHRLVEDLGFAAMTFGSMIDWFAERDACRDSSTSDDMISPFVQTRIDSSDQSVSVRKSRLAVAADFARRAFRTVASLGSRVGGGH
ncbi:MAG: hypothetical protein IPJ27_09595 [Candidatus Accumulibacter sp.]|uniref:Polysaccharide deacetylase n=1 Tax=Candidatus Accumulibacter proximus TaxID=2954385 RepID=A0A935PYU8_9PROT|nr:hypothetical protein [Candidatus Accumulibacter proximus]